MKNNIEESINILENMRINESGTSICEKCVAKNREYCYENNKDCQMESINNVLTEYKRLKQKNEKKDKIIDEMTKVILDSGICDYFIKSKCKHYAGENKKTCDNCIREYFERRVDK